MLKLRGRIRHHDRFGLSYWLWENTRALAIPYGHPGTDDVGVLEQITRIYKLTDETDNDRSVSIDVGAYIGIISLAMSKFSTANHLVHSFEADDKNFGMLSQNLESNHPHTIHTHRTAVGGHIGTAKFTRTSTAGTNHLGTDANSSDAGAIVFDVPVTTLDAFAEEQNLSTIKLLKIDAEGVDIDVLRGAKKLLSQKRIETVIVEVPLSLEGRLEMIEFLTQHDMTSAYIERNTNQLKPATEEAYTSSSRSPLNMLAARSDLAANLID